VQAGRDQRPDVCWHPTNARLSCPRPTRTAGGKNHQVAWCPHRQSLIRPWCCIDSSQKCTPRPHLGNSNAGQKPGQFRSAMRRIQKRNLFHRQTIPFPNRRPNQQPAHAVSHQIHRILAGSQKSSQSPTLRFQTPKPTAVVGKCLHGPQPAGFEPPLHHRKPRRISPQPIQQNGPAICQLRIGWLRRFYNHPPTIVTTSNAVKINPA